MAKTWEEQLVELDKEHGNPDYYLVEKFEVMDDISLVDRAANRQHFVALKAEWTAAYVNDLPDSCFAVIESGGEKDAEGKTVPRSLRHLPYKDADGKVDLPHLRNALARLPQTSLSPGLKARAKAVLTAAARSAKIGEFTKVEDDEDEGGINVLPEDEIAKATEEALREAEEEEKADSLARKIVKAVIPRLRNKDAPTEDKKAEVKPPEEDSATVKALRAELDDSKKEIQALKERYAEAEKAAERERLEREIDGFVREGKVLPKTKDFLMAALTGETLTVKAEGGERSLTPKEAILEFLKESQVIVPFGERTAAADKEDYGKFNGKSAAEYAREQLAAVGKLPKS